MPGEVRVESGVQQGDEITLYYDSMLTKLIVWAPDRPAAIARLQMALQECVFSGVGSNVGLHREILALDDFARGRLFTGMMGRHWQSLHAVRAPDTAAIALAVAGVLNAQRDGWGLVPGAYSPFNVNDPWAMQDDWRLFSVRQRTFDFLYSSKAEPDQHVVATLDVAAGQLLLMDQAEAFRWSRLDEEGGLIVHLGDATVKGQVRVDPERKLHVRTQRGEFDFRLADAFAGGEDLDAAAASLRAPMPGLVLSVSCAPGDQVKKGDPLMVLTAMKLEQTIVAPRDGVIEEVFFSAQDQVAEGAVLLKFQDAPAAH
ncbi:MAG: hypothetical protein EBU74_07050 [Betaproteobacteria bacterium]|nr:hypothetical protein [Betaproteobacteria bacterium]